MGTNYYLLDSQLTSCDQDRFHIGKSAVGWCFALHVIPEHGLHTLVDWIDRWWTPGTQIQDEYGTTITPREMLSIVIERTAGPITAATTRHRIPEWRAENHAVTGPNGLLRNQLHPKYCTGHGAGTWDLCPGVFC